jgi:hypothetical protein
MTNFFQYLDIVADSMKRLRDPGITPCGMDIQVDQSIYSRIYEMNEVNNGEVRVNFVERSFHIKKGIEESHLVITFGQYTFRVFVRVRPEDMPRIVPKNRD